MAYFTFALVLLSVLISATAQLLLKFGMSRPEVQEAISQGSVAQTVLMCLFSLEIVGGLVLYGVGAIVWLFVLAKLDLSVAYPFVGLGFIVTMLFAAFLLREDVSLVRVAGALLILAGCALVARSA